MTGIATPGGGDDTAGVIRSVADTALWTAGLRAIECERPDAVVADRLAATLAGGRGRAIARAMSPASVVGWGLVVRTSAIDRLLLDAVQGGVDTVINLGAGMDTRPYRLPWPAHLRWIEVDLPDLIDRKSSILRGQQPVCRVERLGSDLLDGALRRGLLAQYAAQSQSALVVSEGVIPYFSNTDVMDLANDLASMPNIGGWLLDFDNAGTRREPRRWARQLQAAPFLFSVTDWFAFFERFGWRARRVITSAEESERIGRPFPYTFPLGVLMHALPREVSRRVLAASGAVWLARGSTR